MITVSSDASVFQTADFERNLKRHRGTAWSWQLTDRALRDVACLAWSKQKKITKYFGGDAKRPRECDKFDWHGVQCTGGMEGDQSINEAEGARIAAIDVYSSSQDPSLPSNRV